MVMAMSKDEVELAVRQARQIVQLRQDAGRYVRALAAKAAECDELRVQLRAITAGDDNVAELTRIWLARDVPVLSEDHVPRIRQGGRTPEAWEAIRGKTISQLPFCGIDGLEVLRWLGGKATYGKCPLVYWLKAGIEAIVRLRVSPAAV